MDILIVLIATFYLGYLVGHDKAMAKVHSKISKIWNNQEG